MSKQGHAPDCNCHVCEPYTEWLGDARLASEAAPEQGRDPHEGLPPDLAKMLRDARLASEPKKSLVDMVLEFDNKYYASIAGTAILEEKGSNFKAADHWMEMAGDLRDIVDYAKSLIREAT